jgi:kynurenine formamidase
LKARLRIRDEDVEVDLEHPVSLAIEVAFDASEPRHFGAPRARSSPMHVAGFSGSVAAGASCNCATWTLTPHCNGTHTECVGHLTREPLDALRVVPAGLIPALLVTTAPESASGSDETSDPVPRAGDRLVTRRRLETAWPAGSAARALVIRTLPNGIEKRERDYTGQAAPYLTREAAQWLVEQRIEHLVVDLPSIDRIEDHGRLTAHRIFFGLPPGSSALASARRTHCTVTELAYVPDAQTDGAYLLELQVPALAGDAVPSRPLLYAADRVT